MLYMMIEDGLISSSYAMPDNLIIGRLSTADFKANPATGTWASPERVTDGHLVQTTYGTINQYVDIEFNDIFLVTQYRLHGVGGYNGDGTWKIQHWNGIAWIDNTVDVSTRGESTWTEWTDLSLPVFTKKIRIVCTLIDSSGYEVNSVHEFEMRGHT